SLSATCGPVEAPAILCRAKRAAAHRAASRSSGSRRDPDVLASPQGKALLGAGMLVYDALTLDRNFRISDTARRIPLTRFLDRERIMQLFPGIPHRDLTGAAIFCDGQMYNP